MAGQSAAPELDALDLAAIWPFGGQPGVPVHSATGGQDMKPKAGGREDRC